jgi:uncharacterized alkaline shock family protein YloU
VDRGAHVVAENERGQVGITSEAIAQIVGHVVDESYGVVGKVSRRGLKRLLPGGGRTRGIAVRGDGSGGVEIELTVVVEYGLNLAEVSATVRSRVGYEVTRLTGLAVSAIEVRIEDVRRSG